MWSLRAWDPGRGPRGVTRKQEVASWELRDSWLGVENCSHVDTPVTGWLMWALGGGVITAVTKPDATIPFPSQLQHWHLPAKLIRVCFYLWMISLVVQCSWVTQASDSQRTLFNQTSVPRHYHKAWQVSRARAESSASCQDFLPSYQTITQRQSNNFIQELLQLPKLCRKIKLQIPLLSRKHLFKFRV